MTMNKVAVFAKAHRVGRSKVVAFLEDVMKDMKVSKSRVKKTDSEKVAVKEFARDRATFSVKDLEAAGFVSAHYIVNLMEKEGSVVVNGSVKSNSRGRPAVLYSLV